MIIFKLESLINFGKYKGSTVEEVINDDPSYLAWAVDEIEWFELDEKAEKEMDTVLGYEALDDYSPIDEYRY